MSTPILGVGASRSLGLQTKEQNDIENYQTFELTNIDLAVSNGLKAKYSQVQERSGPAPIYNCHGLTFACRRTGIYNTAEISKILKDDRYELIRLEDNVLPGDVILYFDESGDIEHSGIVLTAPKDSPLKVPKICSKWGKGPEYIHPANHCPYTFNYKYYRMKNEDPIII